MSFDIKCDVSSENCEGEAHLIHRDCDNVYRFHEQNVQSPKLKGGMSTKRRLPAMFGIRLQALRTKIKRLNDYYVCEQ